MTSWKHWVDDRRLSLTCWCLGMVAIRPALADAILLFAPLVVVPMGLALIEAESSERVPELRSSFFKLSRFVSALLLLASSALPQGGMAGVLATPWLFVTYWLAIGALGRRVKTFGVWDYHTGLDIALLFMTVGSTFALFSRLGIRVNDFSHEIVLLTGVHFHYAGFVLPVMAAFVARKFPSLLTQSVLFGCLGFTALLALGINASPHVEIVAAVGLVASCVMLAVVQSLVAMNSRQPQMLAMLTLSSMSLIGAMGLAAMYAFSEFYEAKWITISTMVPLHGMANAFGFAYCGLWGWEPEFSRRRSRLVKTG